MSFNANEKCEVVIISTFGKYLCSVLEYTFPLYVRACRKGWKLTYCLEMLEYKILYGNYERVKKMVEGK
jgi:hypothetical protein